MVHTRQLQQGRNLMVHTRQLASTRPKSDGAHETTSTRPKSDGAHETTSTRPKSDVAHETTSTRPKSDGAHDSVHAIEYRQYQHIRCCSDGPRQAQVTCLRRLEQLEQGLIVSTPLLFWFNRARYSECMYKGQCVDIFWCVHWSQVPYFIACLQFVRKP